MYLKIKIYLKMKRSIDNGDYREKQTPAFFSEKGKGYIIYYILLLIQLSDGVMFALKKNLLTPLYYKYRDILIMGGVQGS